MPVHFPLILAATVLCLATPIHAKPPCGGNFGAFITEMKREAVGMGHLKATVDKFFTTARHDPKTIRADRAQGVFQKSFIDFSRALISQGRLTKGRTNAGKWDGVFDRIESKYGINRGVLLAFWAFETDYGAVQGNFNTLNSLVTLAHDCRRPELFRPQVFAALALYERGDFAPATTKGAWAGEIGMVQMLPGDILENGTDGDGDGKISLKTSPPDALMSGAKVLSQLGWRPNQPWMQEIIVPQTLDWSKTGLNTELSVAQWARMGVKARKGRLAAGKMPASVLLPMGRKGPAFLVYPNFRVYFEWNKSFVYVTTAAYFATRLEGAAVYNAGSPDPAFSAAQMKALQKKLKARGHDVGKVDGILGAKTRAAVQKEQARLGLAADAWPTAALLQKL